MATVDIWIYREVALGSDTGDDPVAGRDLTGYRVEARDGHIGKIDSAGDEVGGSYIIVDTGPWIFGKKVMLPAGVIERVDDDEKKVYVDRTKEQIKNAPELDESMISDSGYRNELGSYYGPGGQGYRDAERTS
jgi:hypothetical protein